MVCNRFCERWRVVGGRCEESDTTGATRKASRGLRFSLLGHSQESSVPSSDSNERNSDKRDERNADTEAGATPSRGCVRFSGIVVW